MLQPAWDDRAPVNVHRLGIQVFSPRKGQPQFVRLLARLRGCWMHWCKDIGRRGRTLPCFGKECVRCHTSPAFLKLYGPAELQCGQGPKWRPIVIELPESCSDLLSADPRGLVMEFGRPGGRADSPVTCKIIEQIDGNSLPEPFEIEPVLNRLWGISRPPAALAEPVLSSQTLYPIEEWKKTLPFRGAKDAKPSQEDKPATAAEWRKLRAAAEPRKKRKKA